MTDKEKLRIIFYGTPAFAVASLEALITNQFNIVAVVTAPDKPAGRGLKMQESAVKTCALKHQIPVLQPAKLKDEGFINELRSLNANLQVVIAFRMLPEVVWNMPQYGTVNLHASLLPNYRGAAPINWAIINGETETGVSTFLLQHEIDTGDLILTQKVAISPNTTAGQLHDELMQVGSGLIVKTVEAIASGNYTTIPQQGDNLKAAPKIFTHHCLINWNNSPQEIINQIRGLSPYPGAFTDVAGQVLKIYSAWFETETHQNNFGALQTQQNKIPYIRFAVQNGWIYAKDVQLQGKKRMNAEELARGWKPLT